MLDSKGGKKKMGSKKQPSLREIAEKVPCSASTVSIVLNNKGNQNRISPETQAKIKALAEQMGYSRKHASKTLPKAMVNAEFITIAIFLGLNDSAPLNEMLMAVREYPSHKGKLIEYSIHPYFPNRLKDYGPLLTGNKYDGIIILPTGKDDAEYLKGLSISIPCMALHHAIPGYNAVTINRINCGALVANLFIAKGHKKVGVVSSNTITESSRLRAFGFTSAYEAAGITDAKITVIEDKDDKDYGLTGMDMLLDSTADDPVTAVFVAGSNNFSGTINSLRKHNLSAPQDLDLVIFGNYSDNSISMCISPSITTVGHPAKKMMYDAIDLICRQIDGGILHGMIKEYCSQITFRESCVAPEGWIPPKL